MDAFSLFDVERLLILGTNASWSRLFGRSVLSIRDVAINPMHVEELLRSIIASGKRERASRGSWKRPDGSQFSADFTIGLHAIGAGKLGTLLIEEVNVEPARHDASEESPEERSIPDGLSLAVRDRIVRTARQQQALLKLASADEGDLDGYVKHILKVDAETLDVARSSFWRLSKAHDSIVCEAVYDLQKGAFDQEGAELFSKDYPNYFGALQTRTLIPAHDAMNDPRTSELAAPYLGPLGIGALLDVPVFMRGELVGVLCHEHMGPARGWTLDEQQFAMSIGQTLSIALAARSNEDVARSLRRSESKLAEAHSALKRALRPGDGRLTDREIAGYKVGQLIGRGSLGEVYRAVDTETDDVVAIKVLHARAMENPENIQRFFREARVTQSVPSEHVARIYDVGTFDKDTPYMAMELLEGHDLGWHLRRVERLGLEQVVELVEHTSRALAAVRDAGVVHRDLKPSNLFLVDALPHVWKVVDFGLSRGETDPYETVSDEIVGTPAYMTPEHVNGGAVDHRTDLYGLAAVAYRALTGRAPFEGELHEILRAVVLDYPPPVSSLVRDVPIEVELVLAIALAKAPRERFDAVEEFARAFADAARGTLDEGTRSRGWRVYRARR